jgi:hypothetical protein
VLPCRSHKQIRMKMMQVWVKTDVFLMTARLLISCAASQETARSPMLIRWPTTPRSLCQHQLLDLCTSCRLRRHSQQTRHERDPLHQTHTSHRLPKWIHLRLLRYLLRHQVNPVHPQTLQSNQLLPLRRKLHRHRLDLLHVCGMGSSSPSSTPTARFARA